MSSLSLPGYRPGAPDVGRDAVSVGKARVLGVYPDAEFRSAPGPFVGTAFVTVKLPAGFSLPLSIVLSLLDTFGPEARS